MAYNLKKRGRRKGSYQLEKIRSIKGLTPRGYAYKETQGEKLIFKRKDI